MNQHNDLRDTVDDLARNPFVPLYKHNDRLVHNSLSM